MSGSKCSSARALRATVRIGSVFGGQPAEHAGAAFGGLEQQQHRPGVVAGPAGQRFDGEFVASSWNSASTARLSAYMAAIRCSAGIVRCEVDQQGVAVVLDVGHDPLDAVVRAVRTRCAVGVG